MTVDPSEQLYASWDKVKRFIETRRSATLRLNGTRSPRVDYCITDSGSITLELELDGRQKVPRSTVPLIGTEEISREGMRMARLRLTQQSLIRDFHDMLNAVADRVIVHRHSPDQAFNETLRSWRALLERARQLGPEKRLGLLGELMVLAALARSIGWADAVDSWRGPAGEEHDFGSAEYDIEVKTTSSERRHHIVQGIGQLTPTPGRPLWLVSLQLTRGGAHGTTLSERIASIRHSLAQGAPDRLERFDAQLATVGWSEEQPDDERWSLRTMPLILPVDDRLPRLSEALLDALPVELRSRIDDISYRIDLTGFTTTDAPPVEPASLR